MLLKDKVAVITGGAGLNGLGFATARMMVEQGASWDDCGPDLTDGAPRPLPQMKVTPIF